MSFNIRKVYIYIIDLAFSAELGKEERKVIHKAALKHGLKSKSYGKGDDRHLVLGRTAQQKMEHFNNSKYR